MAKRKINDYYGPLGSLQAWEEAQYNKDVVIPRREATSRLAKIILGAMVGGSALDLAAYSGVRAVESYYLRKAHSVDAKLEEIQKDLDLKVKLGEADAEVLRLREAQEGLITEYGEFRENVDSRISEEVRKANAEREEKIKSLEREVNEFYEREKANPGKYSLGEGSNVLDVAKTIFCEAAGEWTDSKYHFNVGATPRVRAHLTGLSIPETIATKKFENGKVVEHAYSFVNEESPMHRYLVDPLVDADKKPLDVQAWDVAYDRARIIMSASYKDVPKITHFYVDTVKKPDWAIDKKPLDVITLNGKTTRFYYIPEHFT